ncbi:MAG: nitrogen fixation protein NifQ [Magnetospirillum sp.]|nr:nitrogen fixation protein NifQ [Magnetospirillum sp.]
MSDIYQRLMAVESGEDGFDRHVFACILAKGASEAPRPLGRAVGLGRAELERLLARFFPAARWLLDGAGEDAGEDALEEPDLRRLLVGNATRPGAEEAGWLAAMVARRSLEADHLWQDLGLTRRADLSGLLNRHFAPLAARNIRDMKWKKFFYRQMCEDEGVSICKSPVCDTCTDFAKCYGPEE